MNRRQLLGMIGLGAPIVAVGVGAPVAATALMVKSKEQKDIEDKMEETPAMLFTQTVGEEILQPQNTFFYGKRFKPGTEKTISAKITIGPDGHLYAKTNGQWNKIA